MQLGIGSSLSKFASSLQAVKYIVKSTIEAKLKLYFQFRSSKMSELDFVGIGSCQFEGNDDEIQIPDHASLDGMDQLTIMCWFKYDSTCDNAGNLISKEHDDAYQLQVDTTNKRLQWFVNNVSDSTTSSSIQLGKWHHAACTYDSTGNGTGKMYVDGKLNQTDTTFSGSTIGANAHPLYFGGDSDSSTNFGGFMKNVGMWKRVLSESEIQNIMYKTYEELRTTETTHMLGWWPLEVNGDSSYGTEGINKFDGTASGHVTFSRYNKGQEAAPRKPRSIDNDKQVQADLIGSGSVSLNGSSDYVNCGTGLPDITSGAFTVVGWFKIGDTTGDEYLFSRGVGSSGDGYSMAYQYNGGSPRIIGFGKKASSYNNIAYSYTFEQDRWYHIGWVKAATNSSSGLYIDGVLVYSKTWTVDITADTDKEFKIGSDYSGNNEFNGKIAQLGWFNTALTTTQINSIKEKTYSELTSSEKTNLVSWWGLDELSGTNGVLDKVDETFGSDLMSSNNGDFATWTDSDTIATWTHKDSNNNSGGGEISQVGSGEANGGSGTGSANFHTTSPTTMYLTTPNILDVGKVYKFVLDVSYYNSGTIRVRDSGVDYTGSHIVNGKITGYLLATEQYTRIQGSDTAQFTVDNFTVQLANGNPGVLK